MVAPPNATALFRYSSAPGSGKDTAEGKGVHREEESEQFPSTDERYLYDARHLRQALLDLF